MKNKPRNRAAEHLLSPDQLELKRRKWKSMIVFSGCCAILTLAGFLRGLKVWLDLTVATRDTAILPGSTMVLAYSVGVFAFSIQQWRRVDKQIKQTREKNNQTSEPQS